MPRRHARPKPDPSAPRSGMSATPATRNEGGCKIVPCLPRETKVDVRLCHACHAKCRGVTRRPSPDPSAPRSGMSATPATRNEGGCKIVPRLPCETEGGCKVVPRLSRKMPRRHARPKPDPSAPPSAISATPATQNDGRCEVVPRLPRKTTVDVSLCRAAACHAKCHACRMRQSCVCVSVCVCE